MLMSAHRLTDRPLDIVLVLDHAFVNGGQAKVALDSAFGLKDQWFWVRVPPLLPAK